MVPQDTHVVFLDREYGRSHGRGSRVANQLPLKRGDYFDCLGGPHVVTGVLKRRGKQKRELAEGAGLKSLTLKMEEGAMGQGTQAASRS